MRRSWALATVSVATFMSYLDNNIVNVALPSIQRDLGLSTASLEWVVSAYILVFAGLLLAGGRLADAFGRKRLFLSGLTVFTGASLAAGLAGSDVVLIAARAAQGVGAALFVPASLAVISHAYPGARERAAAVGIWTGVGALGLAVGPVLGGVLAQHASWGWIFTLNVPIGLVTVLLGFFAVTESKAESRRLDVPGILSSGAALTALTWALIEGGRRGWTSPAILGAFAAAAVAGLVFVLVERRAADPMLSVQLFRVRAFAGGIGATMLWAFGLFGIYFFTAIYLQDVLGFTPTTAGLAFLPMALFMIAGAVASERLAHTLGAGRLVGAAMALMALGIASVALFGRDATYLQLMPSLIAIGIGAGLATPLTASIIGTMPAAQAGVASAVFNAAREVAGLLGITVIGAVLSARSSAALRAGADPLGAYLSGYRLGLLVAGGLVLAGAVTAYAVLRDRRAAAPSVPLAVSEPVLV